MNIPNLLSLARLLLVPLAIWLMVEERYLPALWIFVGASVTDAVDGFIARQFDARTEIGSYLDPLADKTLLVSVYVTLGWQAQLENWLVILVVSRDIMIVGGSLLLLVVTDSFRIEPLVLSKFNTLAQMLLAAWTLASLAMVFDEPWLRSGLVWLVAGTTLASGTAYLVTWWRRLMTSIENDG